MPGTYKTATGAPDDARGRESAFETKIAVVLRDDLAGWQALNVTAFVVSGITAAAPELGRRALRRRGRHRLPADARAAGDGVRGRRRGRAGRARPGPRAGLRIAVFTADLFATGSDADNRAAVVKVARDDLDLVGIAVHGPRNAVDKIVKGVGDAQRPVAALRDAQLVVALGTLIRGGAVGVEVGQQPGRRP